MPVTFIRADLKQFRLWIKFLDIENQSKILTLSNTHISIIIFVSERSQIEVM